MVYPKEHGPSKLDGPCLPMTLCHRLRNVVLLALNEVAALP